MPSHTMIGKILSPNRTDLPDGEVIRFDINHHLSFEKMAVSAPILLR